MTFFFFFFPSFTMRPSLILALLLSIQFLGQAFLVHGDVGTAVSYSAPYTPTKCGGSSQDQFPPGNMFVAVSRGLWNNGAACGRKYTMRCLSGTSRPCKGGTIDVVVVDLCPNNPCQSNFLLSVDAFAAISSNSNARLNVEYIQI